MSVGTNIKRRRFELKMSQDELAKLLGYKTRSTIAKIESGENSIAVNKLSDFAKALDTNIESLLSGISQNNILKDSSLHKKTAVVILAGGKSTRNSQNIPNQFIKILGKPIILYPMQTYQNHPLISNIYIVCLKGWEEIIKSYCQQYNISKLSGIIEAGNTGILSIKNAIEFLEEKSEIENLILQESTRPLVSEEIISKIISSIENNKGSVICESMSDYLQFFINQNEIKYIDRENAVCIQSPEAYKFATLKNAFKKACLLNHDYSETCCAMFMHNLGYKLKFIEGNHKNIKVVRQEDLIILPSLLKNYL